MMKKRKIVTIYLIGLLVGIIFFGTSFPSSIYALESKSEINIYSVDGNASLDEIDSFFITLKAGPYQLFTDNRETEIKMEGFGSLVDPRKPKLPSKIFHIGLPPESRLISIELIEKEYKQILGNYTVELASPIANTPNIMFLKNNEEVYSLSNPYPQNTIVYLGMGQLRKYSFARIRFNPISYIPIEEKLFLCKEIKIKISYSRVRQLSDELLTDSIMDDTASKFIDNYKTIKSYYPSTLPYVSPPKYDYLIITKDDLVNSIDPFKSWKNEIGYSVKVVNTSWISSQYSGNDMQEEIRNFLKDKYASWGIEYVLIIGNHFSIPMRYCYPHGHGIGDGKVPTDYYYADLTGDWDSDGDGYFGEMEDSPDFSVEVFIGRIPFDDPEIVEQILEKTIAYQQDNGEWKKKALLLGSFLWLDNYKGHQGTETDGAELMEELWQDILIKRNFSRTTMYEKEGFAQSTYDCDFPINNSNIRSVWPENYGLVSWTCHGEIDSISRLVWSSDNGDGIPYTGNDSIESISFFSNQDDSNGDDVQLLDDDKPSIVFAAACDNAKLDNEYKESLGESLLKNGAVVFIGSTVDAYGPFNWSDEDDGGIDSIDYYFFKHFINNNYACGKALYSAKLHYSKNLMGIGKEWWNYQNLYGICIFGDPSTYIQEAPDSPSITGPSSIKKGKEFDYIFSASDLQQDDVYYLIDWGDSSMGDWLGPFPSGEEIVRSHEWERKDTYVIKAKAKDAYDMESNWTNFEVTMPKSRTYNHPLLSWFTQKLFSRFFWLELLN